MADDLNITRVRGYALTPEQAVPTRYHGRMDRAAMNIELVRVTLAGGAEGAASYMSGWAGRAMGCFVNEVAAVAEQIVGHNAGRRAALTQTLLEEAGEGPWMGISMVDCAMWDAYGRAVGQPVWRLLGGYRERIPVYASTEAFMTMEEYLDATKRFIAMGYPAIKFHMNTDPDFDLELVALITSAYGEGKVRFMTDQEQLCTFDDAVRLGQAMSKGPFDWLEAPLPDRDLDVYVALNEAVDVDILNAGNILVGLDNWHDGLSRKAWSRLRFDACNAGGISTAVKAMGLAKAMNVPVEIQSFGYQTAQLANLHVMLGMVGNTWFEHPAPSAPFDYPARSPIALDALGCVSAPRENGLGIEIDWAQVERDATVRFDSAG
jgi:L-alanine-DL-glutamate epimerase-like enolase superfamily enzyme